MDELNFQINRLLTPLNDPLIKGILLLFLILYGSLAAPSLPSQIKPYLDNVIVRIVFLALIVWTGNHDPVVAVGIAVAFFMTVNLANSKKPFEAFEHFEGPNTAIYPGCMNMTVFDLLESFKNDKDALLNAMMVARVPADVTITDYNAPLIGTYLLNKGFTLKAPCNPPGVDQQVGLWK